MDAAIVEAALADLHLGAVRFYDRVDSTNEEAARWARSGAPDRSLVVADQQTAGRGRAGRSWITPPGVALAFSFIYHPSMRQSDPLTRLTALGAIAVCEAVRQQLGLEAEIKWPNDVLVNHRKAAGILAEAQWDGTQLACLVLGIGINVATASVSEELLPRTSLLYPATSLETALGAPVDRLELLHAVLAHLLTWLPRLPSTEFLQAWEDRLAFKGEWVQVLSGAESQAAPLQEGQVIGLAADGGLILRTRLGEEVVIRIGDVRLRPGG